MGKSKNNQLRFGCTTQSLTKKLERTASRALTHFDEKKINNAMYKNEILL